MNVIAQPAKSRPFPKRKQSPIAAQATGSAETFVRYVIARAVAQLDHSRDAYGHASARFPGDARLRTVIRAVAEPPTSLANTPALAVMGTDYVESLQPISAAAQIFRASRMMLNFDRYASIPVNELTGFDGSSPAWVAEGQPAPVRELASGSTVLEPYKLEFIITVSREMLLGSNAEKLVGDALRSKIAYDLDQTLFDALPAIPNERPAGLRSYNARLPESTASSNEVMAMMDIGTLVAAAEQIAGGEPFYFIGRSKRIAALRLMMKQTAPPNFVLLPSAASLALPESVLLCVIPRAVPSAVGLPEVEIDESGAVEMNDAPASSDLMAGANVRSLFQSDTIGIKVRLPASWGLRHPAGANWITCLWPTDTGGGGGGGGIPDAPFDGTPYGRRDGAWDHVLEPAPDDGFTYARRGVFWQQLEPVFAPIISPSFTGSPTSLHPPPFDDSTRIPTTAWTRATIATEAGGVPEAPPGPLIYGRNQGAWLPAIAEAPIDGAVYGRQATNWSAVAPLVSPAFTGNPTAPTQPGGSRDARIATCEFVIDEVAGVATGFLPLTGGAMTGQLIAATGGNVGNVSLGFGDALTGIYRAGGTLGFSVNGVAQFQLMGALIAYFQPVNMGNFTIQSLGDPANATDALNLRTGDTRYMRSGGPLIAPPGTAPTDVGLGVGDATTGFYRAGTSLALAALGDVHMLFNANRTAEVLYPLTMRGNVISNLADATAADHALSRGAADARYLQPAAADALYLRTPAVAYDVPANVNVPASGAFVQLASVPFLTLAGNRRVMVSVSCNVADVGGGAIFMADVRIPGMPQRRVWIYSVASATSGFSVDLTAVVVGPATVNIPIEVASVGVGTTPSPLVILGGGQLGSQIVVMDLGPA